MPTQQQQSGTSGTGSPQAPQQQPPQQQQQQGHFPHQGLNGGWQSDKDLEDRRKMIAKISHLLRQRKPNAPQEWLKKLPQMVKRLEESLYRSARSFAEYNDSSTLKHRLQELAVKIGIKTKKIHQQQAMMQQNRKAGQKQPGVNQFSRPQPLQQSQQTLVTPPTQPQMPVSAPQPSNGQQGIVNMSEIHPIMRRLTISEEQPSWH